MTQTNIKSNSNSSTLKETRLSKGLTLEIVHEATKIPMDALRAIEEGYSTRILTPFYYRGFIKIYAEFLGLNIADVLKEYDVKPTVVKIALKQSHSKPAVVPKGQNIVRGQQQDFRSRFWTNKNRNNILRGIFAIIAIVIFVKFVGCVASSIKFKANQPKVVTGMKVAKNQHSTKKEYVKEEAAPEESTSVAHEESNTIAVESRNHKVTLALHAPKDTWVQVKADGKIVFQMTMKKGTVENWEADNTIELSGKNIGNLDLEVNGKDISSLSSSSRHAKKVVITKNGLTVKK
ncbi:MAG: helix-turn-helix domain-containing protein [Candidatus Omnitrophota bacterium]